MTEILRPEDDGPRTFHRYRAEVVEQAVNTENYASVVSILKMLFDVRNKFAHSFATGKSLKHKPLPTQR